MFRRGHVTYPKRRKKTEVMKCDGVPEPVRKSTYDIVKENFKVVNRVSYLHRIIYVSEHSFKRDNQDTTLEDFMAKTINEVNNQYSLELLSGFLLIYTKYFVHLVEGNEGSLHRHLVYMMADEEHKKFLGIQKLLIHVSHIRKRLVDSWIFYYGSPSKLLTEIDINSDLENSGRIIFNCIKKMYNLVLTFDDDEYQSRHSHAEISSVNIREDIPPHELDKMSIHSSRMTRTDFRVSNVSLRTMQPVGLDPYRSTLPENEMLDFVILTKFTQDLTAYCNIYGVVPQRNLYKAERNVVSTFRGYSFRGYMDFLTVRRGHIKWPARSPDLMPLDFYFRSHLKSVVCRSKPDALAEREDRIRAVVYRVWPVPTDFIPYDTFAEPFDCITELPRERKTEQKKEEGDVLLEEDESEETTQ
ncbi:hypothetical protein NQ317_005985 [Molorchus minor]|uniref:BLUF domain-containing protein n=1 Tax=Molorchus minor TaxID=1323400 RepID=A0ABQ9IRG4_9CUCU|nr:hypothetical protein NQ317_005985 [Molorchus minor]